MNKSNIDLHYHLALIIFRDREYISTPSLQRLLKIPYTVSVHILERFVEDGFTTSRGEARTYKLNHDKLSAVKINEHLLRS